MNSWKYYYLILTVLYGGAAYNIIVRGITPSTTELSILLFVGFIFFLKDLFMTIVVEELISNNGNNDE